MNPQPTPRTLSSPTKSTRSVAQRGCIHLLFSRRLPTQPSVVQIPTPRRSCPISVDRTQIMVGGRVLSMKIINPDHLLRVQVRECCSSEMTTSRSGAATIHVRHRTPYQQARQGYLAAASTLDTWRPTPLHRLHHRQCRAIAKNPTTRAEPNAKHQGGHATYCG